MTIALPTALSTPSAQWTLFDFLDRDWQSTPATGSAVLILDALPEDTMWLIDHMVCLSDSTAKTTLRLYLDSIAPRRIRDGSASGNFDVGDWPNGLLVPPRASLIAEWTGTTAGAVGVLSLQARVYRRV